MQIEDYKAKPDKTIAQHNQELLSCLSQITHLGYITDEKIIHTLKDCCKYHDYGKVNKEFQNRVNSTNKKLKFDSTKEVPHNVLSIFFIDKNAYSDKNEYATILYAVAYHHNYCNVAEELRTKKELIQNLLEGFPVYEIGIKETLVAIKRVRETKDAIIIKGILQKCDHCASGGFPAELPNDYLMDALENLLKQWQNSTPNKLVNWNELQLYCKSQRKKNIIVIAPTGMGKTEAALHWIGNNKGFFVLPLRTAINAMYDRIRTTIVQNEHVEQRLALLHSESAEHLLETHNLTIDEVENYIMMGKQLSLPLTITTMDQLFDFVFRYAGYELKLATFSYSKFIIDEIQMYNAELLAYLVYGLEQIVKVGGQVAIITATLAPFIKDKLIRNIHFEYNAFHSDLERHNIKIINEKITCDDIIDLYEKNRQEGKRNKILVICNTIKKAQAIYKELENCLGKTDMEKLHMLHSRYVRMDRQRLEQEIKEFAGSRKELDEPQNGIWISTSIVEASLDLDFDYLFTELQDLNSLFQRMGRCNRLGLKEINEPNCFVYLKIEENLLGDFIDERIYEISREELINFANEKNASILTEAEKMNMLEKFTTEAMRNSQYMRTYNETYSYLEGLMSGEVKEKVELRHIQTVDMVPYCIYEENVDKIQSLQEELLNMHYNDLERSKVVNELKKYVLSVPSWCYRKYLSDLSKGNAINRGRITISDYEKIPIVGCTYTKLGFESMDDGDVRDPMIW